MLNFLIEALQNCVYIILNAFIQTPNYFNFTVAYTYAQILSLSIAIQILIHKFNFIKLPRS